MSHSSDEEEQILEESESLPTSSSELTIRPKKSGSKHRDHPYIQRITTVKETSALYKKDCDPIRETRIKSIIEK